ncbi:MAG: glycosyltransferase [Candidatus Paracaedibacteraceae bacterium]|nr:glycosyltransferase [Candidatus Paracaedibacteraceae bacterium]
MYDKKYQKITSSFESEFKRRLSPRAEFIYFDQINDKKPFCKPDWSPRLYQDFDYIDNFYVVRADLFIHSLAQIKDNPLNFKNYLLDILSEKPYKIQHQAFFAFCQQKIDNVKAFYSPPELNLSKLKASIIIPTKDGVDLLKTCVDSILKSENTIQIELIIINNNSNENNTFEYFKELSHIKSVKVLDYLKPYNWSKINNFAASQASGDIFVFLNNDMKVITPNWLDKLCNEAMQHNVGVVGAQLLFPDNSIQHAGMTLGMSGFIDHIYRFVMPSETNKKFISSKNTREISAVTGACHVIERSKFIKFGGYDEDYMVCCSDVELCIRLNKKGLRTIYDGSVMLYHYESMTREAKKIHHKDNYRLFWHIWYYILNYEPYYNSNFNLKNTTPNLEKNHII